VTLMLVLWLLIALVAADELIVSLWCRRWGTTAAERGRSMSGDALIRRANYEATLARKASCAPLPHAYAGASPRYR